MKIRLKLFLSRKLIMVNEMSELIENSSFKGESINVIDELLPLWQLFVVFAYSINNFEEASLDGADYGDEFSNALMLRRKVLREYGYFPQDTQNIKCYDELNKINNIISLDKHRDNRAGKIPMEDGYISKLKKAQEMLEKVLNDVPLSNEGGNVAYNFAAKEANSLLKQALEQVSVLPPLNEAPILWVNRSTFILDEIKNDFIRDKLKNNPDLEEKVRSCKTSDVLTYLDIIYGDYIKANLLSQADLRGGTHNPPLDARLFHVCSEFCLKEGMDLNKFLPNSSVLATKKRNI